jgi:hypothetical protein
MEKGRLLLLGLAVLVFGGCREDNEQYCLEARTELANSTFTGLLRVCNAQPPNDTTLVSTVTFTAVTEDSLTLNLVGGTMLDTTLAYAIRCDVVEKTKPLIFISHPDSEEEGQYHLQNESLAFHLMYGNCGSVARFEGQAQ